MLMLCSFIFAYRFSFFSPTYFARMSLVKQEQKETILPTENVRFYRTLKDIQ
jgi:hypothetical protein